MSQSFNHHSSSINCINPYFITCFYIDICFDMRICGDITDSGFFL